MDDVVKFRRGRLERLVAPPSFTTPLCHIYTYLFQSLSCSLPTYVGTPLKSLYATLLSRSPNYSHFLLFAGHTLSLSKCRTLRRHRMKTLYGRGSRNPADLRPTRLLPTLMSPEMASRLSIAAAWRMKAGPCRQVGSASSTPRNPTNTSSTRTPTLRDRYGITLTMTNSIFPP